MRHQTRAAIENLNSRLKLDHGRWQQDWEVELADSNRVAEFCQAYQSLTDADEKFALMTLITASYDDLVAENGRVPEYEERIAYLLSQDWELHIDTIGYWALVEQPEAEDGFAVTPFMRRLWRQHITA